MHLESIHQHKRKRKDKRDNKTKIIDNIVVVVAILYPLSTIPQIMEIWINNQTAGVSLLTWTLLCIMQGILFIYGILHKEKRLLLMWGLWILVYLVIIIGLLIYG